MKDYKVIFFDWDGTAVKSRTADATKVLEAMKKLLLAGTKLVIVSGTTYANICGGQLESLLPKEALQNLYLGLARGNYNYAFNEDGKLYTLCDLTPSLEQTLLLHKISFEIHNRLLDKYALPTDIVFTRPNYNKIDINVSNARTQEALFMQEDEVGAINHLLQEHGFTGGLCELLEFAVMVGKEYGVSLVPTTDAKYLEVGYTTKTDNVNFFMDFFTKEGITQQDCCFWGDEYGAIFPGIWGSDAQMITQQSNLADFYSVSNIVLPLPKEVTNVGGSCDAFLSFLEELSLRKEKSCVTL